MTSSVLTPIAPQGVDHNHSVLKLSPELPVPSSGSPGKACSGRLKKCKSLTWDACTWNSEIIPRIELSKKFSCLQSIPVPLSEADLNVVNTEPVQVDQNEAETKEEGNKPTTPKSKRLVRRATFSNFPKDLSGDHFERGGHDHKCLRRESGAEELPPASRTSRRLRRIDSAEMVRKAFRPGILYGVAPEGKHELTDDEDDEVVLIQDDSQLSDEEALPAPPPVNLAPTNYPGKFGSQSGNAEEPCYQSNPAYGNEAMPMHVPPLSPDPYYFQAMNSHLLYCLQVQQQMQSLLLANSMASADPLQFMNAAYGPPQGTPLQMPFNAPPQHYPLPRHPDNGNARFGYGGKKPKRGWKKADKNQRQNMFHEKNRKGSVDLAENSQASPLLLEYKSCGKKPSVQELQGHVVEFSTDSCGSRYIQHMMEIGTASQREQIIDEAIPMAVALMQDMFGNYVMQNFLEHATSSQRQSLVSSMEGIVLMLSTQQHGCRVVQKALDLIPIEVRNALLSELVLPNNNISHCARDQHATHVLQKAVELLQKDVYPEMQMQRSKRSSTTPVASSKYPLSVKLLYSIEVAVQSEVMVLAVNPNACRLVQRVLGDCNRDRSKQVWVMMSYIEKEYPVLSVDQHGNFILQHILESGQPIQAQAIQAYVAQRVIELSQHKFGSHLVEKALTTATAMQASVLLNQILNTSKQFEGAIFRHDENHNSANYTEAGDGSVLLKMMKDPYANFVLQRALDVSSGEQRETLCREITKRTELINQFTYGRHILSHIAKIQGGPVYS